MLRFIFTLLLCFARETLPLNKLNKVLLKSDHADSRNFDGVVKTSINR